MLVRNDVQSRAMVSAALAALLVSGCAFCRIRPPEVQGVAVGHAHCRVTPDGTKEIKGGALSNNLSETIAAGLTAVAAYFGVAL